MLSTNREKQRAVTAPERIWPIAGRLRGRGLRAALGGLLVAGALLTGVSGQAAGAQVTVPGGLPGQVPLADSDWDGLFDSDEWFWGTNPFNPDTDFDGMSDGQEVYITFTNPLIPDFMGPMFPPPPPF
jgi:hypothetical protein